MSAFLTKEELTALAVEGARLRQELEQRIARMNAWKTDEIVNQRDALFLEVTKLQEALRESARRIVAWKQQHGSEPCRIAGLTWKLLEEVIAPALPGVAT